MKKGKKILLFAFIVMVALIISFVFLKYNKNTFNKLKFEMEAAKYEEKYLSTKSDIDLINLVYFLENSDFLDERRIKYTSILIDTISEDSIAQSEMSDYYNQFTVDDSRTIPISFYIHDLLCFERYDLFIDEFVKYYSSSSYSDQKVMSSVVIESYKNLKTVTILEALVDAYSKVAKQSEDEIVINNCIGQIVSLKDAVKYVDGETISIDNEILRSMTVDGEHIPITAKGKVIKYYSVTTGDYIDENTRGTVSMKTEEVER